MSLSFDLVVLGAGPGGYAAAIRAAQLGLSTALIERGDLGGVCLNLGCIPSKAMLRSAEVLDLLHHASDFGLKADGVEADYGAVVARRDQVVDRLRQGLVNLLRGNSVQVLMGEAHFTATHQLEVDAPSGKFTVEFTDLIIATGSHSARLPVPGADLPTVIDSDGALQLREAPRRVVVVGGGAVGVEWAQIWRSFGSEVTIIELLPQIIPSEELEIARELNRAFTATGIQILTGFGVREFRAGAGGLQVVAASAESGEVVVEADVALVAVGRRPNVDGLNLQALGLDEPVRALEVDGFQRSAVPHVFAVGDVTGRAQLAHVATHQGLIAAETIRGHSTHPFDPDQVPAAIFTHPEVSSVGLRERDAQARGISVQVGRFPFAALGRAAAAGQTAGFVKVVAEAETGKVLGVHIIGAAAGDLIGEAALALRMGATIEDIASTMHVHPTFSEAILEAAWATAGTPLHVPRSRRTARTPS